MAGGEALDFADQVFAVGVATQRVHVRAELLKELLLEVIIRELDHLLHNVVRVLVLHHEIQSAHLAAVWETGCVRRQK